MLATVLHDRWPRSRVPAAPHSRQQPVGDDAGDRVLYPKQPGDQGSGATVDRRLGRTGTRLPKLVRFEYRILGRRAAQSVTLHQLTKVSRWPSVLLDGRRERLGVAKSRDAALVPLEHVREMLSVGFSKQNLREWVVDVPVRPAIAAGGGRE